MMPGAPGTTEPHRYAPGTSGGTAALYNRILELEVTLAICESRLTILGTGGHLPPESILAAADEARRVLDGHRAP